MEDKETPRVGQYCTMYVGSDKYAAQIVSVEKDIIWVQQEGRSYKERCKKNRSGYGYGEQVQDKATGKWKYRSIAKYRNSWYPIEGVAYTRLDPGF